MADDRFQPIVELLNRELRKAHDEGLSISFATNTYLLKLRQGELVVIDAFINKCLHPVWTERHDDKEDFLMCMECGVTKDIEGSN